MRIFRELGAREPESWAGSETREGIPQLALFLFLRAAWKRIVDEDDTSWLEEWTTWTGRPDAPCADAVPAVRRILSKGVDPRDLTTLVRVKQFTLLFELCYQISDCLAARDDLDPDLQAELEDVGWNLFETDAEGRPVRSMNGLHELVLAMDPTGREMRPRSP